MADAIISAVVQQLTDITVEQIKEEVKLVRGVKKEVSYLKSKLNTILSELDDAERRGYKEKSIQRWLGKLEDLAYDIADLLDEWNLAILKHRQTEGEEEGEEEGPSGKVSRCLRSSLCFKKVAKRHEIAKKIEDLKKRMEMIVKEKNQFKLEKGEPSETQKPYRISSSSVDELEIHGREAEKDDLVRKLILEGAGQEEPRPPIIALQGSGGIGKTTLAQLVYKDDRVVQCFEERIWVCVSDISDDVKIAKGIIEQVSGSSPDLNELESCLERVRNSISGEKFFLVLDDVWEEYCEKWGSLRNTLKYGGPGSKILVTTRSERVARLMRATEIHELGLLSDKDCWLLMSRIAFSGRREEDCVRFQDIGMNIARKCKGLPLAAKVLGSYLCFKDTTEEWGNVLTSDIWQLEKVEVELFPHLFLSYNELSPAMKRCFSYCAIFPKDFLIDVDRLIRMWMALGYLRSDENMDNQELRGKDYFDNLIMRSLFQKHEKRIRLYYRDNFCTIHDVVHDFAMFLRKSKSYDLRYPDKRVEAASKMPSQACDPSLIPQVKVFRSLVCDEGNLPLHKFDRAAVLRVLSLSYCGREEIPEDVENLIHLRYLDLSGNRIGQIPRGICKLYYLETLYLADCELKEIPEETGNLIHLTHLDLSYNHGLKKLTKAICNLEELRSLGLRLIDGLQEFPEGIERLVNLKHILNRGTKIILFHEGLKELTNLQTLEQYCGFEEYGSKLEYLNKLDRLSGELELDIEVNGVEGVVHARKAELRNKIRITRLWFLFSHSQPRDDFIGERRDDKSLISNDILEALEPPPMLENLSIRSFSGTKLPGWITSSSLNHLTKLEIQTCEYCLTLPPLGKLPCLEVLRIAYFDKLVQLDGEFLGITETTTTPPTPPPPSSSVPNHHHQVLIGFPKLKELVFSGCSNWREWEDITAEEEGNPYLSIMPCLEMMALHLCSKIEALPHRLLRKASSLKKLKIDRCPKLSPVYRDEEGSARRSLSHIPRVDIQSI